MALDKTNRKIQLSQADLEAAMENVHANGWATIELNGVEMTLLNCEHGSPLFRSDNGADREKLEAIGFVLIPGTPVAGEITLQGGSVCSTKLMLNGQRFVRKTVKLSELEDVDTIRRHKEEANWLSLEKVQSSGLFPRVLCVEEDEDFFYDIEFFPAYSLGELMFREEISDRKAKHVVQLIISACSKGLHNLTTEGVQENYCEKALRRYQLLITKLSDQSFFCEIMNRRTTIQGIECRPLRELFSLVEESTELNSIINCSDARFCHGDLIPEDVLFSRRNNSFQLIDPNPQVRDPLADFGKMQMSFELCYDLAYRDLIQVEYRTQRGELEIWFSASQLHANYIESQKTLADWFPELVYDFRPPNSLEAARYRPEAVRLMAGLQALSLPIFHALQHNKLDRAKYFYAKGHLMLETAVKQFGF